MSNVKKFTKKPVTIEAIQWDGSNYEEVLKFIHGNDIETSKLVNLIVNTVSYEHKTIRIDTLEGAMTASKNDWIIKGISGEYYPCKPEIFEASYVLS